MAKKINVPVEITGSAKSYKASTEDAARATSKLEREARARSREIERNFKMVTIAMAKVAGAVIVAKKAFETYGKVMSSTNATGDKLAIQQSKIKFSLEEVKRSLATLDFEGIGKKMKQAARDGETLAKALDLLGDLTLRLKLIQGDANYEMIQQELIFRNTALGDDVRRRAAERYLEIVKELEIEQLKVAQAGVKAALAASSVSAAQFPEETLKYLYKNLDVINANEDAIKKYLDAQKKLRAGGVVGAAGTFIPYSAKEMEQFRDEVRLTGGEIKNLAYYYERWMLIAEPERVKLAEAWRALSDVMTEAAAKGLKPLRSVASLMAEGKEEAEGFTDQVRELQETLERVDISQLLPGAGGGLAGINTIQTATEAIGIQQMAVEGLEDAFKQLFYNTEGGWSDMIKSMLASFKLLIAEIVAKAGFLLLLRAIFPMTLGVGATTQLMKMFGTKRFAGGGIVSGPTLATVGEYAGAKTNPEVIAPLSKLKGMMGGAIKLEFKDAKLKGNDIYLSVVRTAEIMGRNT